ncbi:MAG: NAD(P)-dependent oxidoreductase [bacterium]|nr:NAD(P)-dependent oxidoreductase [bacterium]
MRRRTILITGTTGRLGRALALDLHRDHDIVQFDLTEPEPDQQALGRVVAGSITDPDTVAAAMDGVDTVIHSAAIPGDTKPYSRLIDINVNGTFHLLNAAGESGRVESFVYISSVCYHGILNGQGDHLMPKFLPVTEQHPALHGMCYGATKVQSEHWCKHYVGNYGKPVVAIRPSYIAMTPQDGPYPLRPTPERPDLLDYVGVADLVDGIKRAMDYNPADGFDAFLFNAADQYTTTPTLDYVRQYFPGVTVDRERLEAENGFGALVDCSHAREVLGWSPTLRCARD